MRDGIDAVGALRGPTRGTVMLAIVGTLASTGLTERLRRSMRGALPRAAERRAPRRSG